MKPWIIVLIVLAVIAVILGLLYYFGKKAGRTAGTNGGHETDCLHVDHR